MISKRFLAVANVSKAEEKKEKLKEELEKKKNVRCSIIELVVRADFNAES